jgi:tetratricopeptide (TPR) repeat protein
VKQGEQTLDALIAGARKDYEANPTVPASINTLVEALLKRERSQEENGAVAVLMKAYEDTKNYSFKERADEVRIRQFTRLAREAQEQADRNGSDEDRQAARKAMSERVHAELDIYRERVRMYPTDLKAKFKLGTTLFRVQRFDEAIPILQAAQPDPRNRTRAQLLIGRCFFEKQQHAQATEVLAETLAGYELQGDAISKELLYWLGRAYLEAGRTEDAKTTLGKLVRLDYNYADEDARKRLEGLG